MNSRKALAGAIVKKKGGNNASKQQTTNTASKEQPTINANSNNESVVIKDTPAKCDVSNASVIPSTSSNQGSLGLIDYSDSDESVDN